MKLEAYRDDLKRMITEMQEQLDWTIESNLRITTRHLGEPEKDVTAETIERNKQNIEQLTKIVERLQRRIDGEDV